MPPKGARLRRRPLQRLEKQPPESSVKSFGAARLGFCRFFFAIFRSGGGFERLQKPGGCRSNFIDGSEKRGFVGLGRFVEARDFPHKLEGGGADLFRSYRRIEIVERLDISAHE